MWTRYQHSCMVWAFRDKVLAKICCGKEQAPVTPAMHERCSNVHGILLMADGVCTAQAKQNSIVPTGCPFRSQKAL